MPGIVTKSLADPLHQLIQPMVVLGRAPSPDFPSRERQRPVAYAPGSEGAEYP
jgi:hypothetical protein